MSKKNIHNIDFSQRLFIELGTSLLIENSEKKKSLSGKLVGMKVGDYRKWKKTLTPNQEKMYFKTPEFIGAYDMNKTTYDFMNPFLQTMNLKYGSKENKGEL